MKENNEIKSTAHSKYRCQYHIIFAPKLTDVNKADSKKIKQA